MDACHDWHVCGRCGLGFDDLDAFVGHKKQRCKSKAESSHDPIVPMGPSVKSSALGVSNNNNVNERASKRVRRSNVVQTVKASQSHEENVDDVSARTTKTSLVALLRHVCSHQGCGYSSRNVRDLRRHMRSHTGEKPHVCSVCDRSFARRDKLLCHQRSHSSEEQRRRPHKCQHCSYAASEAAALKAHLRIHKDERPYKCQVCPYSSRTSSQLVVHLRTHTGDSPFACDQCQAAFKTSSDLKRHRRTHSGEKPYSCPQCSLAFAVKSNLNAHMASMHDGPGRKRVSKKLESKETKRATDKSSKEGAKDLIQTWTAPSSIGSREAGVLRKKLCEKAKHHSTCISNCAPPTLKSVRASYACSICQARFVRRDSLVCHESRHRLETSLGAGPLDTSPALISQETNAAPTTFQVVVLPTLLDTKKYWNNE